MKTKIRNTILNVLSIVCFVFLATPELAGQNNDSLILAKESQHFNFYSTNDDRKVLDTLAMILEKDYTRITDHLGIHIDKKIDVRVYPDLKAFHTAINYPNAPEWVVGTGNADRLMMVSPLNPGSSHTYESLLQVIVHELTHAVVIYACGNNWTTGYPRWLSEGYACYEAGQINESMRKSIASGLADKLPPTWTQLAEASDAEFGNMNGFGLSETIIEFLVDTYGFSKLVLLIKEPENMEAIYGLSKDNLEKQWVQYLKHE